MSKQTLQTQYANALVQLGHVETECRKYGFRLFVIRRESKKQLGKMITVYHWCGSNGAVRWNIDSQSFANSRAHSDEWKAKLIAGQLQSA